MRVAERTVTSIAIKKSKFKFEFEINNNFFLIIMNFFSLMKIKYNKLYSNSLHNCYIIFKSKVTSKRKLLFSNVKLEDNASFIRKENCFLVMEN